MITYKDIESKVMPPEKREESKQDWFSFYVGRKITYLMTIPFLYTSISPNTITWISILTLILGFAVSVFATSVPVLVVVWALFFLWSLLDGVDGNVARYRKQYSAIGDILDTMGGYLAISLMYFSAGIMAANNECFLDSHLMYDKQLMIIIGGLSSICGIFPRLMLHKIKSSYGNESTDSLQKKASYSPVKILVLNISSVTGGSMVFFIISIFTNALDVFTVVYFAMNFLKMAASIYIMLKKLNYNS